MKKCVHTENGRCLHPENAYCFAQECKRYENSINYSVTEDLGYSPCKYTLDGYCLRNEGDYCRDGECNCPHWIAEIKVVESIVTCETTITICTNCKQELTEPKTDCR